MTFPSINKSQAAVISTVLTLVILGAGYFFIYLPNNEKRVQEQRFNALQNIDRNIHRKIDNSIVLLNNLLTGYLDTNKAGRRIWGKYIATLSSANFTLTNPDSTIYIRRAASKDSMLKNSPGKDTTYAISVNNDTREISLFFFKRIVDADTETTFRIAMKFSFKQFIQFLLPKDVFDEYIIFSKGRPVYESFPAGISYVKEDSLLAGKNGFGSSGIRNQVISGTDYKIFLQPVGFDANNEWIIGGLLSSKHYQNEKTQLSTQMILLLATIMFIGVVAFPWLKLYQMGSKDRLTISDGIASIFISMLLVSLVFFVFFNYNHPLRPDSSNDPRSRLAAGIQKAFKNELVTLYHRLQQFDSLAMIREGDIVNLNKDSIAFAQGGMPVPNASMINTISSGINMNQVFWVNKDGGERNNWTVDNMNGPRGNFKNREYFKKIIEQRQYRLDDEDTTGFSLDQGISWTNGAFRSVISMRSRLSNRLPVDSPVIAALSFNFKTLDNVVLPTGNLFAIADAFGNVLYHSESSRNLNENLLNVFSRNDKLKSLLDATAQGTFSTKYYGNNYEVTVEPMGRLPYFIIIFEDAAYHETRDMETYSFTFCMLFFFFLFLVLQLLATFLVSAKRSFFKKQLFDTSWIGPKISNHHEYVLSAVFNCIIIFLLICSLKNCSFLKYLFILLLSVTFIPLFLNTILAKRYAEESNTILQFKTSAKYCLWGFIVIIVITAARLLEPSNFYWLAGYGLLVIFIGIGVYYIKESVYSAGRYFRASPKFNLVFGKWNYLNSFTLMALTRLIITSGLPVVFFYISSHNYEQNLSLRYKQIDFAKRLFNKFPADSNYKRPAAGTQWPGVYYDESAVKPVAILPRSQAPVAASINPYTKEEKSTIALLKLFRLQMTEKAMSEDNLDMQSAVDTSFFFNDLLKNACTQAKGTVTYTRSPLPGNYLEIESDDLNYHYPSLFGNVNKFRGGVFWALLVGAILIFYFVISSVIKKLFALNLPYLETWKKLDETILVDKDMKEPLFIIGLPGAGKKQYILDKIRNGEMAMEDGTPLIFDNEYEQQNNVFVAELINIPSSGNEAEEKEIWSTYIQKVFNEKNRVIIVNHFEYNIQDSLSNRFKLEFLERLFLENKCKIVILSTIHPVAFLDSALDQSFREDNKSVPGQDLERWHVLLGHYRIIVLPLQLPSVRPANALLSGSVVHENSDKGIPDVLITIMHTMIQTFTQQEGEFVLPDYPKPFRIVLSLEGYLMKEVLVENDIDLVDIGLEKGDFYRSAEMIRQETNHTYFLKKFRPAAYEAGRMLSEETRIDRSDELSFKLQVSSHYFYMYIWQSLTKEEKFLLYDLAEDNLVNSFDDYNLSMLIAKGVVTRPDGTLKLFNRGFRNFILTAIGNSEAEKIKNRIKENGNWNTLKNPLQLVILAILAFLLTSQEEAFAKLITYAAALGAAVPAVLKLVSFFDKSSKKPE